MPKRTSICFNFHKDHSSFTTFASIERKQCFSCNSVTQSEANPCTTEITSNISCLNNFFCSFATSNFHTLSLSLFSKCLPSLQKTENKQPPRIPAVILFSTNHKTKKVKVSFAFYFISFPSIPYPPPLTPSSVNANK